MNTPRSNESPPHDGQQLQPTAGKSVVQNERIFRLLVDAVDEYAIFALDAEGNILTWNQGAHRLKGYSAEEVIGTHFSRFYTKVDIDRRHPQHELEIAIEKGKYEEEGWRVRKDGTTFWANVVITALRDETGKLQGFGKVTRDLTARRNAELRLRESEERFRLMVESVQDYAIFMLDPKGHITTWNLGAERNKGYSASEIIGKHFSIFYPEKDQIAEKPKWELEEAIKNGRFEDEGFRVRKDGETFWANVIITPVFTKNRDLLGFAKVTRNLTERKLAEEALREANADLEKKVDLRTKELSASKARAEAAVKSRDEFFSMASHELKTPLSALMMQSQLREFKISRGDFSDFKHDQLAELCADDMRQIQRLVDLIDRMLDVSRLSIGQFELDVEIADLAEIVKDVVRRLTPTLGASGNQILLSAPESLVAQLDRLRIEQVVSNLLTNAGKYAPGKPVSVSVQAEGQMAKIFIRDQGGGISKDKQEIIFEPFERLKERGGVGGLGLGLYITKKIVAAHGGSIRVESSDQSGSTFVVELPLASKKVVGNS